MRIFVDTNVLFDLIAQRKPFVEDAKLLLAMQAFGDAELWAAPQSYLDIFYILRKTASADSLQQKLALSLENVTLCSTGHADILEAAQAGWTDLEDATIAICAKKSGADYLVTRDAGWFARSEVRALSPSELRETMERDFGIVYDLTSF